MWSALRSVIFSINHYHFKINPCSGFHSRFFFLLFILHYAVIEKINYAKIKCKEKQSMETFDLFYFNNFFYCKLVTMLLIAFTSDWGDWRLSRCSFYWLDIFRFYWRWFLLMSGKCVKWDFAFKKITVNFEFIRKKADLNPDCIWSIKHHRPRMPTNFPNYPWYW